MQHDGVVVYRVPRTRPGWELPEETMPESTLHDETVELLKAILVWWARGRESVRIARNLAVRWDESNPRIGVDPDVCVLSPAPPLEDGNLRSVRTWAAGHAAPILAIEVVSETNPDKDYAIAPDKYAASGTPELWIFDPNLAGPSSHSGPHRLQIWRRDDEGRFVRAYAGEGPAFSQALSAWAVVDSRSRKLRIADDASGSRAWPTAEEAALTRVAELERAVKRT